MNASLDQFFVYAYLDPRKPGSFCYGPYTFSHEPFYVGKGKGERHRCHLWTRNRKAKHPKVQLINRLLALGSPPLVVKLRRRLTEEQAFAAEVNLITVIGRRDLGQGPLLNLCEGGLGHSASEATRRKISAARKGQHTGSRHPMFGKHHSPETIARFSAKRRGQRYTNQQRENLRRVRCERKSRQTATWVATSPSGEEFIVFGLGEFCRLFGLSQAHMHAVSAGRRSHHHGWTCRKEGK